MISDNPGDLTPLLYQAQDPDGSIRAVFGALFSPSTGDLNITRLGSGQSLDLNVEEVQTLVSLLQDAVTRYVDANQPAEVELTPEAEDAGTRVEEGEDGIPVIYADHQDETPPAPQPEPKTSPVRRAE